MYSVLISKILCKNPNIKGTKNANRNALKYIATRPGVDLTPSDHEDDPVIYMRYIHERPRSHGLFGNLPYKEINDLDALCDHMYKISKKTPVFTGIVSLREDDAIDLGYDKKEPWETMIRTTMPDVAHTLGIPINRLAWVAAVHQEQGHPHTHYMLWRTDEKIQSPFIHPTTQDKCREILSKYPFAEYRSQYVYEKTKARDELIKMSKRMMEYVPGTTNQREILGRLDDEKLKQITSHIVDLSTALPPDGRIAYELVPPDVKVKTNKIVSELLEQTIFAIKYKQFKNEVNMISQTYSAGKEKKIRNLARADADLRTRISNVVLKAAKSVHENSMLSPPTVTQEIITSNSDLELISNQAATQKTNNKMGFLEPTLNMLKEITEEKKEYTQPQPGNYDYIAYKLAKQILDIFTTQTHRYATQNDHLNATNSKKLQKELQRKR